MGRELSEKLHVGLKYSTDFVAWAQRHIHVLFYFPTSSCDYAADSQDLRCTKEYTGCTSEISTAIQMYFVKPGGFNVSTQAVPQGFASLVLKGMT